MGTTAVPKVDPGHLPSDGGQGGERVVGEDLGGPRRLDAGLVQPTTTWLTTSSKGFSVSNITPMRTLPPLSGRSGSAVVRPCRSARRPGTGRPPYRPRLAGPAAGPGTADAALDVPAPVGQNAAMSVAIIMGSSSDSSIMDDAVQTLRSFGIPVEVRVLSAHRTPDDTMAFARGAADAGIKVIIAAAGGAAHLAGVVAAATPLPVIGVPIALANLGGLDSLLAMVQMPKGIPVATVAVNGARNAALLAVRIMASVRPPAGRRAEALRAGPRRSGAGHGRRDRGPLPGRVTAGRTGPTGRATTRPRRSAFRPAAQGGASPATASSSDTPSGITAITGMVDPVGHVPAHVGPALVVGPVDHECVHHLVGDGRQGPLPVPGLPGLPHRLELGSPAQPAVEGGVDPDVEIGGDHPPAHGPDGSASSDGHTKIRAATGMSAPSSGVTVATSSADSQLMITPSASRPASRSIPGRSAARKIGGGCSTGRASRKPRTRNVSYSWSTFSPANADRRKRIVSRDPLVGLDELAPRSTGSR